MTQPHSSPPRSSSDYDDERLLVEFLRGHDAACPLCGYNLRGLTRRVCPECKQQLVLTVGLTQLRLGWLLLALIPGVFSGIAACFVAIPTTAGYFEDGMLFPPLVGAVLFGWISGLFALLLAAGFRRRWRNRFLAQPRRRQQAIALLIWLMHLFAFITLLISIAPYWD